MIHIDSLEYLSCLCTIKSYDMNIPLVNSLLCGPNWKVHFVGVKATLLVTNLCLTDHNFTQKLTWCKADVGIKHPISITLINFHAS